MAIALMLGSAAVATAQSLDVKPGLWKKTVKTQTGGRTVVDSTVDTCLTAADLDLPRVAARLAEAPSCKVLLQDLSPKYLKVILQCKDVLAESTTEVRSRESFVVAATIQPAGRGEQTQTTEQWTFLRANCTSKTAN
jgi:hypothetical protein